MSSTIGNKTPAQTYNDLFYLDNSNQGIDNIARPLISGNGVATNLKLGVEIIEADFNQGTLTRPVVDSYHLRFNDIGDTTGTYQLLTTGGNLQKIRLVDNVALSILSDIDPSNGFEFTLLVQQSVGGNVIVLPGSYKTPSNSTISFSSTAEAIDILKFITYDGGTTWLVYKVAADMR